MPKFFRFPWASSGDKTAIVDETDVSGYVSYQEGRGVDYERDPDSDPLAKLIERDKDNQLFYDITSNLQHYQTRTFPEYITSAQNGGSPYAYEVGAVVLYAGKIYQNKVASNTNAPDVSGWVEYNIQAITHDATSKTTPANNDELALVDSAAAYGLKKLTWANVKAALKSYFDTLYVALSGNQTISGVKTFSSFPKTPTSNPTSDYEVANKKYVDDSLAGTTSGTWTPTITGIDNVTSHISFLSSYTRVGNAVTCFGRITIVPTSSATETTFRITLPVASDLAFSTDLSGLFNYLLVYGYIQADSANDQARFTYLSSGAGTTDTLFFSFSYQVK